MYDTQLTIKWDIGNNSFWYKYDKNSQINVPALIEWSLDDLQVWENIAFCEMEKWNLKNFVWLKDFVVCKKKWLKQNIYIFDNHNHALFFWFQEYMKGFFYKRIKLIHIDQHTDMNKNFNKIWDIKKNENLLNKIHEFTNYKCNVWNFILPAIECSLIWNVEQINTEYSLLSYDLNKCEDFILDIDLDFWDPSMGIEKLEETFEKTRELIKQAKLVTIATSPYFLDQEFAIELLREILG